MLSEVAVVDWFTMAGGGGIYSRPATRGAQLA
jgi:hypothetical protein